LASSHHRRDHNSWDLGLREPSGDCADQDWAWGPERPANEGHEAEVDSLSEQIDRIESKLDAEREQRLVDHKNVETEIRKNRVLVNESVRGLLEAINREVPEAEIILSDRSNDTFRRVTSRRRVSDVLSNSIISRKSSRNGSWTSGTVLTDLILLISDIWDHSTNNRIVMLSEHFGKH
jgi:hypothetical protein